MKRFHCNGWLKIIVDIEKEEAHIRLTHHHHAGYVDVRVTEEVKEYLRRNLRLTPRQIWEDLGAKTGNITEKQLHHWWMEFSQDEWKMEKDQADSAVKLIAKYENVEMMFHIRENGVIAIAFCVKELVRLVGANAVEVGIDATCKYPSTGSSRYADELTDKTSNPR
jgi:hypothetical protein